MAALCGALLLLQGCGDSRDDSIDGGAIPDAVGGDDTSSGPDIYDQLLAVDGIVSVQERPTNQPGYRFFLLFFEQPSNHDTPDVHKFEQYVTLLHRDVHAPTVLGSTGYMNYMGDYLSEPAWLLHGNQIYVEHRFFGVSLPDSPNWDDLRIRQAAADHHRIVEALRPIYDGKWISTGGSKGGMTSIFHRRFYPDDVDATVAYVAPISFGAPDTRYDSFFETVGPAQCRQDLEDFQRDLLENRRDYLEQAAQEDAELRGWSFSFIGGIARAVEAAVIELEWSFWQYQDVSDCGLIPTSLATDAEAYTFLDEVSSVGEMSDDQLTRYMPYYFQTQVELGYPGYGEPPHLADLLLYPDTTIDAVYPGGYDRTFDPNAMTDIDDWVETEGSELMFIYGEYDPWTAGQFELGDATDSYKLFVPEGNHGSSIYGLPTADRETALAALERWSGVTIDRSARRAPRAPRTERYLPPPLGLRSR